MSFALDGHAMPDHWDAEVYRECAEAGRQKAEMLPAGEQPTSCFALAAECARLARLIEAEAHRTLPAMEA